MADESEGAPAEEQVEMDIEDGEVAAMEEEGGDNTMMIIIIGGVLCVVVIIAAVLAFLCICPDTIGMGSKKDCVKTPEFSNTEVDKCKETGGDAIKDLVKDAGDPDAFCAAIKGSHCEGPKEKDGKPCCKNADPPA